MAHIHTHTHVCMLWPHTLRFFGRKPSDVYVRARPIRRGRKWLSTVWCECVEELWPLCSTVAQVTWTRGGKWMGTDALLILHVHSDWKSYGRLEKRLNPRLCSLSDQEICLNRIHTHTVCRGSIAIDESPGFPSYKQMWSPGIFIVM